MGSYVLHGFLITLSIVMDLTCGLYMNITNNCGTPTKQCHFEPQGCSVPNCNYVLTYAVRGEYVDFQLHTIIPASMGTNVYLSFGINTEAKMDAASVVDCIYFSGTFYIQMARNVVSPSAHRSIPLSDRYLGLNTSRSAGVFEDRALTCQFSRKVLVPGPGVFSLARNNSYFILFARGPAQSITNKAVHGVSNRISSIEKVDFSAPPSPVVSTPTVTTSMSPQTDDVIPDPRLQGCGVSRGCFLQPKECKGSDCDVIASFGSNDAYVDFLLSAKINAAIGHNFFLSVGFNAVTDMENASFVNCLYNNGTTDVQLSIYNENITSPGISKYTSSVLAVNASMGNFTDGIFTCRFSRLLEANTTMIHNLTSPNKYYIILKMGNFTNSTMDEPDRIWISSAPVDIPRAPLSVEAIQEGCGTTKTCYLEPVGCQGSACRNTVAYQPRGKYMDFEVASTLPAALGHNIYTSVGFNDEPQMVNASVVDCILFSGIVNVQLSRNIPTVLENRPSQTSEVLENPPPGVLDSDRSAGYLNDGFFCCRFSRLQTPPRPNSSRDPYIHDLSYPNEYYLLVAQGPARSLTHKEYHGSETRNVSNFRVSISLPPTATPQAAKRWTPSGLVKAHGILMILAWTLLAGFGILNARYYKGKFPSKEYCGVELWYLNHRTAMFVTFVCTFIGFMLIFIKAKGWSTLKTVDSSFLRAHPYIGVIVTVFVVVNPIMAYFRPGKQADNRHIFNWCHRSVGTVAFILAVLNACLGVQLLEGTTIPSWVLWVLVTFVFLHVLTEFVLGVIAYFEMTNDYEPNAHARSNADMNMEVPYGSAGKKRNFHVGILLFYITIAAILVLACVIAIAVA